LPQGNCIFCANKIVSRFYITRLRRSKKGMGIFIIIVTAQVHGSGVHGSAPLLAYEQDQRKKVNRER